MSCPPYLPWMQCFELWGGKVHDFSPPPPAIFGKIHAIIEFSDYFLGINNKVIKGLKNILSPASNFINTFWGTLKNGGFSKYRQNYDNFSKLFFISRNTRFMKLQPWGQKASKLPKEPFYKLRINIGVVYGT